MLHSPTLTCVTIALVAYLLGSVPFGYILVRVFRKQDIRAQGSGNIGATNVVRSGARGLGALTFLLDAAKGAAAVFTGIAIGGRLDMQNAAALAGLFALIGHIWTAWLGFKGGKGVATAFGVFLALAPLAALGSLLVFIAVFALSRYVSLASILGAIALPVFAVVLRHPARTQWLTAVLFLIPIIVILKHHANIGRLARGQEYRFGRPRPAGA